MFERGKVIVIDDFIEKDYQEYIKLKLMNLIANTDPHQDINMLDMKINHQVMQSVNSMKYSHPY